MPTSSWPRHAGLAVGRRPQLGTRLGGDAGAGVSISPERARRNAQAFLGRWVPGTEAAEEADRFYGYYALHVLRGGTVHGTLGVNGYGGEVWYHGWRGALI
jgi:hypothetical protein